MTSGSTSSNVTLNIEVMGDVPWPNVTTRHSLHSLILSVLEAEGASGDWEVTLIFTSDEVIQVMHRDYMGQDSPTDIMTFPYEPLGFLIQAPLAPGGDIVISMETAAVNAVETGWGLRDELEFLVVHGILHLLDWNDADAETRIAMLARQSELLSSWRAQTSGNEP